MDRILVQRKGIMSGEGKLSYWKDDDLVLETTSWEDPTNLIPTRTYTDCSKTTMIQKKREAIFLPDEQTGKKGIFLHEGRNQLWSDGCICIEKEKMDQILASVSNEKGAITVTVMQI